jgi:hypothetical protein
MFKKKTQGAQTTNDQFLVLRNFRDKMLYGKFIQLVLIVSLKDQETQNGLNPFKAFE